MKKLLPVCFLALAIAGSAQYSWSPVSGYFSSCYPLYFTMTDDGTLFGTSSVNNNYKALIVKSTDNGETWAPIEGTNYANDDVPRFVYASGSKLFLSGQTLSVSTDGAQSWSLSNSGLTSDDRPLAMTSLGTDLYLATLNEFSQPGTTRIYKSADGGGNWTTITTSGLDAAYPFIDDITQQGGRLLLSLNSDWQAQGGGIYYSDDAGATWTKANMDISTRPDFFRQSAFARGGNNELFVSGYHLSPSLVPIYRSTDNGATWSAISYTGLAKLFAGTAFIKSKTQYLLGGNNIDQPAGTGTVYKGVASAAGISSFGPNDHIRAYPSPVLNELHLQVPRDYDTGHTVITDLLGRQVYEGEYSANLDLKYLPAGVYVLTAKNNDGAQVSTRFVKAVHE